MTHRAYIGLGSNAGDREKNVARAFEALDALGSVARRSSIYRTAPWGKKDQPEFLNAIALLETELAPQELLRELKAIEAALGRRKAEHWGPRIIDLDLLLYDDLTLEEDELRVPHPHLSERAFVLVPLVELDERYARMRDALEETELAGVVRLDMPDKAVSLAGERVRALATFMNGADLTRLRIQRGDEEIELVRRADAFSRASNEYGAEAAPQRVDTIKADLVGIFHLSRPTPAEGEVLTGDRELGYIEALGIRTPIHSMGGGRLVAIAASDDAPVEYGQALFSIARS